MLSKLWLFSLALTLAAATTNSLPAQTPAVAEAQLVAVLVLEGEAEEVVVDAEAHPGGPVPVCRLQTIL